MFESPSQTRLTRLIQDCLLASLPLPQHHTNPHLANYASLLREYPARTGKIWRGLLTCLVALIHGGTIDNALPVAAALELFQNWILVHDDIEDKSDRRRGKPTLHRIAGIPIAINAGDGMHAYMWESLLKGKSSRDVLDEFAVLIRTTTEGQHIELSWIHADSWEVSESDYLDMAKRKGGYYTMVAPLRLGALVAETEPPNEYYEIGMELGVAYQLRDDVLNLIGDYQEYGKEIAGDLWEGKRTLVLLRFLDSASYQTKEKAYSILRKTREEKTRDEVNWLLNEVKISDAIDYAQTLAEQKTQRSISLLQELWGTSSNDRARQMYLLNNPGEPVMPVPRMRPVSVRRRVA